MKWGQLSIIDLHDCDSELIKNPEQIKEFALALCKEIGMIPYGQPRVERFGQGDIEGYSMVLFIETSTITAHFDEIENRAFIDIFSCKEFDSEKAEQFSKEYFKSQESNSQFFDRD